LSVADVEASARWYEEVLGLEHLRRVELAERTMVVLRHRASGLVIGLNQHLGSSKDRFDERRVGLDHVGFAVARRSDLDAWQARLAALGVEHSPVTDTEVGSALVFRDPDNIQLEMWWSKASGAEPAPAAHPEGLRERPSPFGVDDTIRRLAEAATAAGVRVFATIDHAGAARSVGLDMPESRVLLVGNPQAGTPAMLASPDLALELPTRLLVRQGPPGTPGSTVVFFDPVALGQRYGLSEGQVAGLAGVLGLLERALGPVAGG
jgi:uncharacterized protein (DUF302 family)/catechol 2,3-dioxygenase-like lactoylglutathione lyase family enzyme